MIGIVVVSHSNALAKAAVDLASEMVADETRPAIAVAAGLDESTFGTDAFAVSEAIAEVDSSDGILVFLDLGSAVLSAEMALEFVDPEVAERVRLTSAPLVEGLVTAVVTASTGASLTEVEDEAQAGLAGKREHLGGPAVSEPVLSPPTIGADDSATAPTTLPTTANVPTTDIAGESLTWVVRNVHGLHARPAAMMVAGMRGFAAEILVWNETLGKGPVPMTSLTKVTTLGLALDHQMRVSFAGAEAKAAKAKFLALAASDFGEAVDATPAAKPAGELKSGMQIVIGSASVPVVDVDLSGYVAAAPTAELARLDQAFAEVAAYLQTLTAGEQGAIFAAQLCLLHDDDFQGTAKSLVLDGAAATVATQRATALVAAGFDELSDPYLRERGQDVRSIGKMVLQALTGVPFVVEAGDQPSVLVVPEIDAASANTLDPATCLGVITITGGATGHGVIVASSKGIPVLPGQPLAASIQDGELVAFDPVSSELWLRPTPDVVARLQVAAAARAAAEESARATATAPAVTGSGQTILVEANLSSLADAQAALGADGAGLVRTEILFGEAKSAPTAAQQAQAFIELGRAIGGPLTIRTWDVGGDKPLPFLPGGIEANPFLGERGIRMMRRVPEVFREQLRAVALAAKEVPVRVMFPMVTTPAEVVWARAELAAVIAEVGEVSVPVGIMVEVPAVAVRAGDFASLVDFVSIGTNDLTQYTMAADRGNAVVSALARSDSAAILDLIAMTARALPGITVAVCGDLASRPELAATLVNLGVTELSVRPPLVPLVKAAVRAIN